MKYISGDTITEISTIQVFTDEYFNTYMKNFTNAKYLLSINNNQNISSKIDKLNDKNEKLIFITKIEYLDFFYNNILPFLKNKFVLITHYGDCDGGKEQKILNHPLLIKWYGQNMNIISNKAKGIPIGLENRFWKRTNIDVLKKNSNKVKQKLLYLNFNLHTNPKRKKTMDNLLKKGFIRNENLNWNMYIEDLSCFKFCISPQGGGIDCHRTWECLYLGVIPIVEKSIAMNFFDDLPILFVDDYNIITIDYLNKIYEDFKFKKFNLNKLNIDYWSEKINEDFS